MSKQNAVKAGMWVLLNGLIAYAVYLCYQGSAVAENIVCFVSFLLAGIYCVCAVVLPDSERDKVRKKGRSVPFEVSALFDVAVIAAIAGLGWFWVASAYTLSVLAEWSIMGTGSES